MNDARRCMLLLAPLLTACASLGDPFDGLPELARSGSTGDYRLRGGDEITVVYTGTAELNESLLLPLDGRIDLPLVGEITAAGRTAKGLADEIERRMLDFLVDVDVAVVLRSSGGARVSVGGAVTEPGRFPVAEHQTVGDAVRAAGGISLEGIRDRVVLLRGAGPRDPEAFVVRYNDLGVSPADVVLLQPHDVLYAPLTRIAIVNRWVELYVNRNIPREIYMFFWLTLNNFLPTGRN